MRTRLRYHDLLPIRENAGFRILAARREDDSRCVLVVPSRFDSPALTQLALERLADAHARVKHRCVPRTVGIFTVSDRPLVELDSPAVCDGLELFRRLSQGRIPIPYEAADGYIMTLREALQAAHALSDPNRSGPLCFGRLSGANVLFGRDGRCYLVGFGHNVAVEDELGVADTLLPFFQAAELGFGGAPSPSGDYVALLSYMRSGIHMVDKGDALIRVVRGIATNADEALLELLVWVEQRVMTAAPTKRASIEDSVAIANRIRRVLGTKPDREAFERLVARVIGDPKLDAQNPTPTSTTLTIGPEAEWIRYGTSPPVKLRTAMRRVLLELVERRLLGSTEPVRTIDLSEAGWPGETPDYEAACNRVYVTVTRLRKVVPEDVIQRFDDGYRLAPGVTVVRQA